MNNNFYLVENEKLYDTLIINEFEPISPDSMYRVGSRVLFNYGDKTFPSKCHVFKSTKELKYFVSNMECLTKEEPIIKKEINTAEEYLKLKHDREQLEKQKEKKKDSGVDNSIFSLGDMAFDMFGSPGSFINRYYIRKFKIY